MHCIFHVVWGGLFWDGYLAWCIRRKAAACMSTHNYRSQGASVASPPPTSMWPVYRGMKGQYSVRGILYPLWIPYPVQPLLKAVQGTAQERRLQKHPCTHVGSCFNHSNLFISFIYVSIDLFILLFIVYLFDLFTCVLLMKYILVIWSCLDDVLLWAICCRSIQIQNILGPIIF